MSSIDLEPRLSQEALATFQIALHSFSASSSQTFVDLPALVRHVAGVADKEMSKGIETAIVEDLRIGDLLATIYRTIEKFRKQEWTEVLSRCSENALTERIRREWIECATSTLVEGIPLELNLAAILSLANSSRRGLRVATGILSHIRDTGLAPQNAGTARELGPDLHSPYLESRELQSSSPLVEAEILEDDSLDMNLRFGKESGMAGRRIWFAFELNRQWLRLGSSVAGDASANLRLDGFGRLLGLAPGVLPCNRFMLRIDEWPTACRRASIVVQSGSEPFAQIESEPIIRDGNVLLNMRLLNKVSQGGRPAKLEVWFGTGGLGWQLLVSRPVPNTLSETFSIQFPFLTPELACATFPGVLKLVLRT